MCKFTVEDFVNARFAENWCGTSAHRRHDGWVLAARGVKEPDA